MTDFAIPFRTVINVTKAIEEDGKKYLLGESSGPEVDADEQFMTKSCVADMATQINKRPVPYLDEHTKKGVPSQLGDVIEATVTPQHHLLTKTLLDSDNPISMMLWKKVRQGKKYGQSVAGHALRLTKKTVADKVLKGFDRIRLDHVANTTRPSWQHGLGAMIAKSQDWADVDWDEVDEYGEDIPLLEGALVEKRSKPDKKAGEKAVVVDSLRKLLGLLASFDWKSYKEYAATANRDDIPLGPPPVTGDMSPVGAYGETLGKPPREVLPQKSYDESDDDWLEYIEKARPEKNDLVSLADAYGRLMAISKALPEESDLSPAVVMTLASMADVLAPPEPLVKAYNEEVVAKSKEEVSNLEDFLEVDAVSGLDGYLDAVEKSGRQVLRNFDDVQGGMGMVNLDSHQQAKPRLALPPGGVLTDFGQVAQETPDIAKAADPLQALLRYREEIAKSGAPLREKQAALRQLGEAALEGMLDDLSKSAPEGDRVDLAVERLVVPLLESIVERIDGLERQIAVTKSTEARETSVGPLIRKSIDPRIRPSRQVAKKATFAGLVRGDQYMEEVE